MVFTGSVPRNVAWSKARCVSPFTRRTFVSLCISVAEPIAGRHFTCATPNRTAAAFARMVRRVIEAYPDARTIPLVLVHYSLAR